MPNPLRQHTMAANNDYVYVVGGCWSSIDFLSDIDMYDEILIYSVMDNTWEALNESKVGNIVPVRKASSVCLDNKVYIIGGLLENDQGSDIIQVFDTEKKICTVFCHLPKPCKFLRATSVTEDTFVVTDCGDIMRLNNESKEVVTVGNLKHFKFTEFGVVLKDNILYVYGGIPTGDTQKVSRNVKR